MTPSRTYRSVVPAIDFSMMQSGSAVRRRFVTVLVAEASVDRRLQVASKLEKPRCVARCEDGKNFDRCAPGAILGNVVL
jgi:hypothetical protein